MIRIIHHIEVLTNQMITHTINYTKKKKGEFNIKIYNIYGLSEHIFYCWGKLIYGSLPSIPAKYVPFVHPYLQSY